MSTQYLLKMLKDNRTIKKYSESFRLRFCVQDCSEFPEKTEPLAHEWLERRPVGASKSTISSFFEDPRKFMQIINLLIFGTRLFRV